MIWRGGTISYFTGTITESEETTTVAALIRANLDFPIITNQTSKKHGDYHYWLLPFVFP